MNSRSISMTGYYYIEPLTEGFVDDESERKPYYLLRYIS